MTRTGGGHEVEPDASAEKGRSALLRTPALRAGETMSSDRFDSLLEEVLTALERDPDFDVDGFLAAHPEVGMVGARARCGKHGGTHQECAPTDMHTATLGGRSPQEG